MQQPITLTRAPAQPADAVVLLGLARAELVPLLARLPAWPTIYRLAHGYLLIPAEPNTAELARFPSAILLRREAANLYLPRDAAIWPALHPEEAAALGDGWGIVLLPGPPGQPAQALAYDPHAPLAPEQLLTSVQPVQRLHAVPLPQRDFPVDDLHTITRPTPVASLEELLAAGAAGVGDVRDAANRGAAEGDAPAPAGGAASAGNAAHADAAGTAQRLRDQARLGLGLFLTKLGRFFRSPWLARAGGRLMAQALSHSPRLSWRVFSQQEAALRDLLRRFQEGKLDEALRRALPLAGPGEAGSSRSIATGWRLPQNDPRFSLRELLGSAGRGGATWLVEPDLHTSLRNAYLRAANLAVSRGDHLRAAYIHAKLLGDFHTAALVLARGGHFREAALLYRDKLNNPLAAAAQFESAGDYDEALRLYRQFRAYLPLGDLLMRLDRPEQARDAYLAAAQEIIRNGTGYLEAAQLILQKLDDPELAATYYAQGWAQRVQGLVGRAVPCGLALAQFHLQRDDHAALLELLRQAEETFAAPGHCTEAGQFFNELTRLVEAPAAHPIRQTVRDASLLVLGQKVRERIDQTGQLGSVVPDLLGGGLWSAAVLSDARYAAKARLKERSTPAPPPNPPKQPDAPGASGGLFRLAPPEQGIIASVQASRSGHIAFLTAAGVVGLFDPHTGQTALAPTAVDQAHSLCIDADGQRVLALVGPEPHIIDLVVTFARGPRYLEFAGAAPGQPDDIPLYHLLDSPHGLFLAARYRQNTPYDHPQWGHTLLLQTGSQQLPLTLTLDEPELIHAVLPWPRGGLSARSGGPLSCFLVWHRSMVSVAWLAEEAEQTLAQFVSVETALVSEPTPVCGLPWQPHWSSLAAARTLDHSLLLLAGIDQAGAVWCSAIALNELASLKHLHTGSFAPPAACVSLTILPSGTVVALDRTRQLHALRLSHTGQLRPWTKPIAVPMPASELPTAVHVGAGHNELVVLSVGGSAVRVSVR
jgi:tetratricopeptide (TPR) repeat protein